MDNIQLKKELVEKCIKKQEEEIEDFRQRLRDLEEESNPEREQFDEGDQSYKDQIDESIQLLSSQLKFAEAELSELKKINTESTYSKISAGAIVITDQRNFFVSISASKQSIQGKDFICISTEAPIYKEMSAHQEGESFVFNGISYKIREIF